MSDQPDSLAAERVAVAIAVATHLGAPVEACPVPDGDGAAVYVVRAPGRAPLGVGVAREDAVRDHLAAWGFDVAPIHPHLN